MDILHDQQKQGVVQIELAATIGRRLNSCTSNLSSRR